MSEAATDRVQNQPEDGPTCLLQMQAPRTPAKMWGHDILLICFSLWKRVILFYVFILITVALGVHCDLYQSSYNVS
jgi:hypothetical protein